MLVNSFSWSRAIHGLPSIHMELNAGIGRGVSMIVRMQLRWASRGLSSLLPVIMSAISSTMTTGIFSRITPSAMSAFHLLKSRGAGHVTARLPSTL